MAFFIQGSVIKMHFWDSLLEVLPAVHCSLSLTPRCTDAAIFSAHPVMLLVSLLLQQYRYWSRHKNNVWLLCTFAGFCRSTSSWTVCSLSCHTTFCFFSVRQRKIRWLSLHSCEPARLRDAWAVHGLPGITTYVTCCAGLVRKKTAWSIQMSLWSGFTQMEGK